MNKILIVEDEAAISNLIRVNLTDAGYRCSCVFDGLQASDLLEKERFDLILLDIMLPKINGYELIEYIRAFEIPVIFLTAKSSLEDKVKGLRMGAEDYLTKPFEILELLARVETVLRRYNRIERFLEVYDVQIDTLSRIVKKNGRVVSLTIKEYELLLLFIINKNIALSRDRIYEKIWGDFDLGGSRTVDLHVQRLRRKIEWEDKLVAVYKIGYRLDVDR